MKKLKIRSYRLPILVAAMIAMMGGSLLYTQRQDRAANSGAVSADGRPVKWAAPMSRPGLSNFYQVADGVYRSAQPEAEGFQQLQQMGIRTVLNLRGDRSDDKAAAGTGLSLMRVKMNAYDIDDAEVRTAIEIMTDPARRPILVHCQCGADRTGVVIAVYRIVVQGWSKEDAIQEMIDGGYNFHKYLWLNIPRYIRDLDVEKLQKSLEGQG